MEISNINNLADKLYSEIKQNGIDALKKFFSKGKTLSGQINFDENKEYLKRMILSQMDIDGMLLAHKYAQTSFDNIDDFRKESEQIRQMINTNTILQFDEKTLDALFGNSLEISSNEEYDQWKRFVYKDESKEKDYNAICSEEEFRFRYENEKNPVKKFIQSFRYRKMFNKNTIETSYVKKIRQMIRQEIADNPNDRYNARTNCHYKLEKGITEYENLKDTESIALMTLASLKVEPNHAIDIETLCKTCREEMKNGTNLTRMGTEYRKKQVTLGSETGVNKAPVIQTIPFEEIPNAMTNMQKEYENIYITEENTEEYIKKISKMYADFCHIQPYEDGNKRTAMCLFNSMLLSRGIIPPPISIANDEKIAQAFDKAMDKDYKVLQDMVVKKYIKMQSTDRNDEDDENKKIKQNDVESR